MDDEKTGPVNEIQGPEIESLDQPEPEQMAMLRDLAEREWERLVDTVVNRIKELSPDCKWDDEDDSPYFDVWDEYKAEMQGGPGGFVPAHDQTIEQFCEWALSKLRIPEKALLWVFGESFLSYYEHEDEEHPKVPLGPRVDADLHRELLQRVQILAMEEPIETLGQRLLKIAPITVAPTCWFRDPRGFVERMFDDAVDWLSADASVYAQASHGIAPDTLEELAADGFYPNGCNAAEEQQTIAELLERFLQTWRAAARAKYGARLRLHLAIGD